MLAAITPELLTEALGRTVSSYEHEPIGTGQMAQSHRIVPTYDGPAGEAPTSIVAKLPSDDATSRAMAQATGAYAREIGFYTDFDDLKIRTPACHLACIADDGMEFVLLLEDLSPAETLEQIGGATPEHARVAALEAAALHGSSWQDPRLKNVWVPGAHIWRQLGGAIPAVYEPFAARFGSRVEPEHLEVVRRLGEEVGRWCDLVEHPTCLWHGDFRLDNMLFAACGGRIPLAVVDWQSAMSGPPAIDVSYLLGTSLDPEARRSCERAVVAEYHDALVAHGATDFDADDAWLAYRTHALFGLILTVPVSVGVQQSDRGDEMFAAMTRRVAQQVIDLDSLAALSETVDRFSKAG